jgi:hypothetical protein
MTHNTRLLLRIFACTLIAGSLVALIADEALYGTGGSNVAPPLSAPGAALTVSGDRPYTDDDAGHVVQRTVTVEREALAPAPVPDEPTYTPSSPYPLQNLTDAEMLWQIAALESGVIGRNSGNGYYGAWQISSGWLAAHGYPYGDGSGGVGDSINPNFDAEWAAINEYCLDHHGSIYAAWYARTVRGMY